MRDFVSQHLGTLSSPRSPPPLWGHDSSEGTGVRKEREDGGTHRDRDRRPLVLCAWGASGDVFVPHCPRGFGAPEVVLSKERTISVVMGTDPASQACPDVAHQSLSGMALGETQEASRCRRCRPCATTAFVMLLSRTRSHSCWARRLGGSHSAREAKSLSQDRVSVRQTSGVSTLPVCFGH